MFRTVQKFIKKKNIYIVERSATQIFIIPWQTYDIEDKLKREIERPSIPHYAIKDIENPFIRCKY